MFVRTARNLGQRKYNLNGILVIKVFANNTNLTFLYKIDMGGGLKGFSK